MKKLIIILCLPFFSLYSMNKKPKIAIVHYRVGRTDGVSLEIEKRKLVLQEMGYEVKLISGPIANGTDYIIDQLEFERPEIVEIREKSFTYYKRRSNGKELITQIEVIAKIIENKFLQYHEKEKFDAILIHNIFSLALHLPASLAFTNIVKKLNIPILVTHHDFYWERERFQNPTNNLVEKFLNIYIPPDNKNITHVCINSLAQKKLLEKTGIDSLVFPDVFDFEQKPWIKDEYNADFLTKIGVKENDLIILQATRIVERKGIELSIYFVQQLEKKKKELIGKTLYNGKKITKESDIVLVLAGYPEQFALPYLEKLKTEIKRTGIRAKFVYDLIGAERSFADNKIYSLWDAYVFADIITYPSLWEGWGNQFIETIFAKKPIVIFGYPVFKTDIKPEGYDVISLGGSIESKNNLGLVQIKQEKLNQAVEKAIDCITSKKTTNVLKENFKIGKFYHGYNRLKMFLKRCLSLKNVA